MADARPAYDTHCCIVGGGPAGMVLALLLGRAGVPTTLLEEHEDFARDFRGDTVHPSTMELLDQLGLADRLLQLRAALRGNQADTDRFYGTDLGTVPREEFFAPDNIRRIMASVYTR